MRTLTVWILVLLLASACRDVSKTPSEENDFDSLADTLRILADYGSGIENGSTLSLYSIDAISCDAAGRVAVLDRASTRVHVFDDDLSYLHSFGQAGNGPGEFHNPLAMTFLSSGNIVIADPLGSGMPEFTFDGDYVGVFSELSTSPPLQLIPSANEGFYGIKTERIHLDDGLVIRKYIAEFDDSLHPTRIYWEEEFPFDYTDIGGSMWQALYSVSYTVDHLGRVFVAPAHTESILVQGFANDGSPFLRIAQGAEPVEKSDQELLDEEVYMVYYVNSINGDGFLTQYTPCPHKPQITGIGVDSESNLWLQSGIEEYPKFLVYSDEGDFLGERSLPSLQGREWTSYVDMSCILIYDRDPEIQHELYLVSE